MNWKKWLVVAGLGACSVGLGTYLVQQNHDDLKTTIGQNRFNKTIISKRPTLLEGVDFLVIDTKLDDPELELFNLEKIINVDLSLKKVKLDVTGLNYKLIDNQEMLSRVKKFYRDLNVDLEFNFVDKVDRSLLDPTRHLAIKFRNRTNLPGNLFDKNSELGGYADLINKECWVVVSSGYQFSLNISDKELDDLIEQGLVNADQFYDRKKEVNRHLSGVIIHELGHLFGLYHTFDFKEDSIDEYLEDHNPNCMSYQEISSSKRYPTGCGFNDLQKKMIHSYLSQGRIYQAYKTVDFDYGWYVMAMSEANNWLSTE